MDYILLLSFIVQKENSYDRNNYMDDNDLYKIILNVIIYESMLTQLKIVYFGNSKKEKYIKKTK